MKSTTRNVGIDLLRIASMLGVVFLHVLGHGGILTMNHSFMNFSAVWFLEILAYPAVNCFVLISGYVGYKEDRICPKIKNLIELMLTVAFYSISIFLLFTVSGLEPFGLTGFARSFFPAILNNYWFFSAYLGLFLLSPVLNLLVRSMDLKSAFIFMSILSLFSVISTGYDTFSMLDGYSLIWFVFMYLTGAMIRKFRFDDLLSKKRWLVLALGSFLLTWLSKVALHFSGISLLEDFSSLLVEYVSPTMVLMSVGLLCFFSKINCRPSFAPAISFFASSAFSVYLIHDNRYIRSHFVSKAHTLIGSPNFALLTLYVVLGAAAIFLVCICIDQIRIAIFKVMNIGKLSGKAEKLIKTTLRAIYAPLEKAINTAAE